MLSVSVIYGHTTLKAPDLCLILKAKQRTWLVPAWIDCIGIPGAVDFSVCPNRHHFSHPKLHIRQGEKTKSGSCQLVIITCLHSTGMGDCLVIPGAVGFWFSPVSTIILKTPCHVKRKGKKWCLVIVYRG